MMTWRVIMWKEEGGGRVEEEGVAVSGGNTKALPNTGPERSHPRFTLHA